MMIDAFRQLLEMWGQTMTCYDKDGSELGSGRAIVQPMTEVDWQHTAGALGSFRKDHFVGLAVPGLPLDSTMAGARVTWEGDRFEVIAVRPSRIAGVTTHLWLALRPDWEDFS